ncbi:MAG: hypothetical protein ACRD0K_00730 [Egibacteraceae bacterium]
MQQQPLGRAREAQEVLVGADVGVPGEQVQGIAAAGRVRLDECLRLQAREELGCGGQLDGVQAQLQRGPPVQRALAAEHALDRSHRRPGEHEHEAGCAGRKLAVPYRLDDAREARRRGGQVRDLVEHHGERSLPAERGEEPQRGLPGGEPPTCQRGHARAEVPATDSAKRASSTWAACWVAAWYTRSASRGRRSSAWSVRNVLPTRRRPHTTTSCGFPRLADSHADSSAATSLRRSKSGCTG